MGIFIWDNPVEMAH